MKAILTAIALIGAASAANAAAPQGRWTNPGRSVIIDLSSCGDAYCGKVSWASPKAKNAAKKPLLGRQLISGLQPSGPNSYKGRVYLPKRDMYATATVRQVSPNVLAVKGCVVGGMICKEQRWTRVR